MSDPVGASAILVPLSFIVQMLPVSVNGFGVREATFGLYFARLGLPLESALALSFIGAALIMLFSVSGAVVNLTRRRVLPAEAPREAPDAGVHEFEPDERPKIAKVVRSRLAIPRENPVRRRHMQDVRVAEMHVERRVRRNSDLGKAILTEHDRL